MVVSPLACSYGLNCKYTPPYSTYFHKLHVYICVYIHKGLHTHMHIYIYIYTDMIRKGSLISLGLSLVPKG